MPVKVIRPPIPEEEGQTQQPLGLAAEKKQHTQQKSK